MTSATHPHLQAYFEAEERLQFALFKQCDVLIGEALVDCLTCFERLSPDLRRLMDRTVFPQRPDWSSRQRGGRR